MKIGLWRPPSAVPRQHPNSQCLLVKPGPCGPERRTRPTPTLQQSLGLLVKLGPPGNAKQSATTKPELAESPDGSSSSDKDEQYKLLLRILGQGSPSRLLEKLREFEAENCQCVDVVLSTSLRGCSHRRANNGLNHVVRVSNHMQNKTKNGQCSRGDSCSF